MIKYKSVLAGLLLLSLTATAGNGNNQTGFSNSADSVASMRSIGQGVYNCVVDINGKGDFRSIQDAIDHAPVGSTTPYKIFIKNGRYDGLIRIPESKPYIFLIGEDKEKVIIGFSINCGSPEDEKESVKASAKANFNMPECAVVVVESSNFYAENITFENTYGVKFQSGPQALALKTNNDRMAFFNCKFRSFQDTWQTSMKGLNDRTYADSCWIEGAVDYFYGGGNAYVENTTFYNVRSGSVIVAPNHKDSVKYGYVFEHCIIDGNQAAADGKTKLGRPWHYQPVAVYLNSTMKIPIAPEGWTDMGPAAKLFAEYNSRDSKGNLLDLSQRRTWYQQRANEGGKRIEGLQAILSKKEAARYTYDNVVKQQDGWNPRAYFVKVATPKRLSLTNSTLHWQAVKDAQGYIVYKNGTVLGFASNNDFKLKEEAQKTEKGSYSVAAVNQYGSFGRRSKGLKVN